MLLAIGHENFINKNSIVAIIKSDGSPAKKLRHKAEGERMLINAAGGKKARSLIVMKSNHVILSTLQTVTLKERTKHQIFR